eukprot:COSAG01_NODE_221_length_21422_cov_48.284294_2_plen_58_part_00
MLAPMKRSGGGGGIHSAERKCHAYALMTSYNREKMPYVEVAWITGPNEGTENLGTAR